VKKEKEDKGKRGVALSGCLGSITKNFPHRGGFATASEPCVVLLHNRAPRSEERGAEEQRDRLLRPPRPLSSSHISISCHRVQTIPTCNRISPSTPHHVGTPPPIPRSYIIPSSRRESSHPHHMRGNHLGIICKYAFGRTLPLLLHQHATSSHLIPHHVGPSRRPQGGDATSSSRKGKGTITSHHMQ
jgi:hypothetical protein